MNFYKVTFETIYNKKVYGYYTCSSLFNLVDWLVHEDDVAIHAIHSIRQIKPNKKEQLKNSFFNTGV